ncbi:MAG: hypothetical protein IPJ88_06630 [Myxococcales bacterium]|nr:MAG: hypothetical protein IPJ88_06630 [Myxococcales bacterium]
MRCNSFDAQLLASNDASSADAADSDTLDGSSTDGSVDVDSDVYNPPCVSFQAGNEFQINTTTAGTQDDAVVAAKDTEFIALWVDRDDLDGAGDGVFAQRFSKSGSTIGGEFQVNGYTNGNQYAPGVTYAGNGRIISVMKTSQFDSEANDAAIAQMFNSSAQLLSEFKLNDYATNIQGDPAVASLGDRLAFVWYSYGQDGDDRGIYSRIIADSGSLIKDEFQVNTYTTDIQNIPAVAALDNGGYVVTWHSNLQDSSGYGVYGQVISAAGDAVGSEFRAAQSTTFHQHYSSVVGLENGHFIVAWHSGTDPDTDVYLRVFSNSGLATSDELRVNQTLSGYQGLSTLRGGGRLASLGGTRFVIVWESDGQDGSSMGVYYRVFYLSDPATIVPETDEILVNQTTTDSQSRPKVAAFEDGSFVVSWQSEDQDGDSTGVFGRIYSAESCQ